MREICQAVDEIVLVAVTLFLRQGFFFWDRLWGRDGRWREESSKSMSFVTMF